MKDLSLHILDIVHNSVRAKASRIKISIIEDSAADHYTLQITDNGKGIAPEMLQSVSDAYTTSRTSRKVGLGLALLRQNAEQAGGGFSITSQVDTGTQVEAWFGHSHLDRPPLGDIAGVLVQLFVAFPEIVFVFKHQTQGGEYVCDSGEIAESLDGTPLSQVDIRNFVIEMIDENLDEIGANR
jgi:hypothetical protein